MTSIGADDIGFILGIFGVLSILFSIYRYFKNPQEDLEKRQAVIEKSTEDKASILAQQLQWEKDSNERRFKELADNLNASRLLAENHIHTVDVRIQELQKTVSDMNLNFSTKFVELSTVLQERFPK